MTSRSKNTHTKPYSDRERPRSEIAAGAIAPARDAVAYAAALQILG